MKCVSAGDLVGTHVHMCVEQHTAEKCHMKLS